MYARHRMLARSISSDPRVAALSCPTARLLFTWMIAHADNLGRMRAEPGLVRLTVLPLEQVTDRQVKLWLIEIHERGLIQLYHVDGLDYLEFTGWNKHQKMVGNMRRSSDLPGPEKTVCTAYIPSMNGVCAEGEVEVEVEGEVENTSAVALLPLVGGGEYPVSTELVEEYGLAYPGVDVLAELRAMRAWLISNPTKQKTKRGILRFMNAWLEGNQNRPRTAKAPLDATSLIERARAIGR